MRKTRSRFGEILVLLCLILSSCAPTIHYSGDTYAPSSEVEVYYDEKGVTREYKVIGKMTNDKDLEYDVDVVKSKMIEKAREATRSFLQT